MKKCITETMRSKALICLTWLVLWQIGALAVGNGLLLPSPLQTLIALWELAQEGRFYIDGAATIGRCISAMLLSFVAGMLAAWPAYRHKAIRNFLAMPVSFFKSVPVMAIIIYVILLVASDFVAIIVCFVMCFPIVYTNVLDGLDGVPADYPEMARVYCLTELQKIRLIYLPAIRPNINAALRLVCGLSWKAVIAAEVLSIPAFSLGYEMLNAKYYLETDRLFAYIAAIVILSICFEKLVMKAAFRRGKSGAVSITPRGEARGSELTSAPKVSVKGVSKWFDSKSVLNDMTIEFPSGEVTAVSGPSGEGKTTLARIIAGLENPDSGRVEIASVGEKASGMDREAGGKDSVKLSMLFQEDRLLPWLNVYDNIALGRMNDGGENLDREIREIAEALELTEALFLMPEELSGGMKHRVALGRTFIASSNLMILDEPFRGLDEELKNRITDRLWEKVTAGKTVIMISHSRSDCEKLAKRIVSI